MELTVKKNTVRLIEAFQARHASHEFDSGKSKTAALKGALMKVSTHLREEETAETLLNATGRGRYEPFTITALFRQAAAAQNSAEGSVTLINLPNLEIGSIHAFLKQNKILDEKSTTGQALDLTMAVAHELTDKTIAIKKKDGAVQHTLVFI